MKRIAVLGASALLLGGCALPLPVQVASWALDGLSYITTEKSMADHGISMVARKDCAVLRGLLNEGDFCRDFDDAATVLADGGAEGGLASFGPNARGRGLTAVDDVGRLGDGADGTLLAERGRRTNARPIIDDGLEPGAIEALAEFETAAGTPGPQPGFEPVLEPAPLDVQSRNGETRAGAPKASESDFALPPEADVEASADDRADQWQARTTKTAAIEAITVEAITIESATIESTTIESTLGEPAAGLYFVIGSFREHANARELRNRYRVLTPAVLAAKLDRGMVFRVVVGPFDQGRAKQVHQRIYDAGIADSWAIRVKPGEWSMAMVDPPAEAPELAQLDAEGRGWNPMTYVRMLAALLY